MPKEILGRTMYTVDEVAAMLGVLPRTIREYITAGKITGAKFNRRWHITEDELDKFLTGNTVKASKPLLNLMTSDPDADREFNKLPDRVRMLFNAWAELNEDQRAIVAKKILEFGEEGK